MGMNHTSTHAYDKTPFLSIVMPVYNGGQTFVHCLQALFQSHFKDWELIVVDDGSTDDSAIAAQALGATVLKTNSRSGPGAARNLGAQVAKGTFLCFVDADCEVHPNTLGRLAQTLEQHPDVDAVFGSYDDSPKANNFVAQYKNLLHHYVHQTGHKQASTFWAGCGAVKRSTFLKLGGFDVKRYPRPSIEDIDLGYRIKAAGGKILLAKQVQVKHHKAWTFINLIKTDVCDRGIPWTRLIQSYQSGLINDLNLKTSSRISVVFSYLLLALLPASFYSFNAALLILPTAIMLLGINLDVYQFFYQKRGIVFAIKGIFMHWVYFLYSGAAFLIGTLLHCIEEAQQKPVSNRLFSQSIR
jgi:glycosyltransferase involved in cell wall biosynthesis